MPEVKANVKTNNGFFERQFKLSEHNTNIKTEFFAGLTTFLTMAYIIFVNPNTLGKVMPAEGVYYATIFGAILGTLCMAFFTNYPFALAPGMGLNAFFVYSVVIGMEGVSWQVALGIVFIEGIIFIILSALPVREMIVNCVPMSLKAAIAAGIGLFIAFIGLGNAGIVIGHSDTLVTLGSIFSGPALVALIGLAVTGILYAYRVKGALIWGILIATAFGWINGVSYPLTQVVALPKLSEWSSVLFKLDISGALKGLLNGTLVTVLLSFLFVDMFDTAGTLVGVSTQAGYLDKEGNLPKASGALMADAIGTTGGALFGTSTVTTYIESASGVSEGGRTGLTGIFVSLFFFLAIFFKPLIGVIPAAATAPALIIVGTLMMKNVNKIDWDDYTEVLPAFITMIIMPLTYNISHGIALGFISYAVIKIFTGKMKESHWLVYVLAAVFLAKYLFIV